jgi:hypothetical protein
VGVADTIYVAKDTNVIYRWDSTAYVVLSPNVIASLVFNDANGFDGNIALVGSVATLTITTALTTGSVGFIGASGALLQDNANFFWDDTNNRLGLGTNAPTTALDVFGSGIIGRINGTSTNNAFLGFASAGTNKWSIGNVQSDHRFRIYNEATTSELVSVLSTGEFGIGIANPLTKFHIDGGATALIANLDANVSVAKTLSFRSDNSNRINLEVSGTESGSNAGANFFLRTYTDAGSLLETPLSIVRSTGVTTLKSLTLTNVLSVGNGGTGASSFTSGSILFSNGTLIAQDNTNLFWDDTNNRLGIGTNIPTYPLDVNGVAYFRSQIYLADGSATVPSLRFLNSNGGLFLPLGVDIDAIAFSTLNTERSRITSAGYTKASNTGTYLSATGAYHELRQSASGTASVVISASNASFTNNVLAVGSTRAASSAFNLIAAYASDFADLKFVVRGDGNVGIKCTPDYPLDVNGVANFKSTIYMTDGTAAAPALRFNNANIGLFLVSGSDTMGFSTGNTERMRLTQGGFLKASNDGSYYSSTGGYHEIKSNLSDNTLIMWNSSASPTGMFINYTATPNNTGNVFLNFYDGNVSNKRFAVRSNGGIENYQANNVNLSDERTKKDITPLESYWDKFKAIEIVKFKYKDQTHDDFNIGVIAQQVEKIAPEFVDVDGWDINKPKKEGEEEIISTEEPLKSIYSADLHHATIKVLQEAMSKIEALEEKIKQLQLK